MKTGASIGAHATIVCGVTIGRWAMIGAGAVVTRDVPDYGLVYGNPARLHGFVCACGEKSDPSVGSATASRSRSDDVRPMRCTSCHSASDYAQLVLNSIAKTRYEPCCLVVLVVN